MLRSLCCSALALIPGVAPAGADGCFTQAANQQLSYRVFQVASPPIQRRAGGAAPASAYYPATDYATTVARGDAIKGVGVYYLIWVNRCIFMEGLTPSGEACRNRDRPKGNGYFRMRGGPLAAQLRSGFSTYERANSCTIAQAMRILGSPQDEIDRVASSGGIAVTQNTPDVERLLPLAKTVTLADGKQERYLVDVCVLPDAVDPAIFKGFMLDYEVFDRRTPAEAVRFLARLREVAVRHRWEFMLNSNPLPREPNGLTSANAHEVLASVDGYVLPLTTGATAGNPDINLAPKQRRATPMESLREQLNVLTRDGRSPLTPDLRRKVFWSVSLYDTRLEEAKELRDTIARSGFGGVMLFRNFVKQGGECSRPANQLIACIAMGVCDGRYGP